MFFLFLLFFEGKKLALFLIRDHELNEKSWILMKDYDRVIVFVGSEQLLI